ncbi:MAG: hypothetical protein AAGE61_14275 [Pseudomonadota bacterium]
MTPLSMLLLVKICVTGIFVTAPFLTLPGRRLDAVVSAEAGSVRFYRLYGVAMLALLVAYGFGIAEAQAGRMPWGVIAMGIVSNGVPAVLFLNDRGSRQSTLFGAFFAFISVGLVAAALFPDSARLGARA